jgi:hypothetical protein
MICLITTLQETQHNNAELTVMLGVVAPFIKLSKTFLILIFDFKSLSNFHSLACQSLNELMSSKLRPYAVL